MRMTNSTDLTIMRMVTDVVVAQVSNNKVETALLPQLMTDLFGSFRKIQGAAIQETGQADPVAIGAGRDVAAAGAGLAEEAPRKEAVHEEVPSLKEAAQERISQEAPAQEESAPEAAVLEDAPEEVAEEVAAEEQVLQAEPQEGAQEVA